MSDCPRATLAAWLPEAMQPEVAQSIDRLRRLEDVCQVAVMPDVHLARDVCVGTVVATSRLIYPAAVGGDIGCGMLALAFDAEAGVIDDERAAAKLLAGLQIAVPSNKHRQRRTLPEGLRQLSLSHRNLERLAERDGRVQLGTLGRGNHFLEFQADQDGRLWVMIHSGSRAVGQAITEHHRRQGEDAHVGLKCLDGESDLGRAYLFDHDWARAYAAENRLAMLDAVLELMRMLFGVSGDWATLVHGDHNHVRRETHEGRVLLVHRKGAQSARADEPGVIPGSMGATSYNTRGRGCPGALASCSHGAGRQLSRAAALQQVSVKQFSREIGRLWCDRRLVSRLREEAPSAYKDIRAVMRAQRELTRIERELRPILTYKGV